MGLALEKKPEFKPVKSSPKPEERHSKREKSIDKPEKPVNKPAAKADKQPKKPPQRPQRPEKPVPSEVEKPAEPEIKSVVATTEPVDEPSKEIKTEDNEDREGVKEDGGKQEEGKKEEGKKEEGKKEGDEKEEGKQEGGEQEGVEVDRTKGEEEEKPKPQPKAPPKFGVGMGAMGGDLLAEINKRNQRNNSEKKVCTCSLYRVNVSSQGLTRSVRSFVIAIPGTQTTAKSRYQPRCCAAGRASAPVVNETVC